MRANQVPWAGWWPYHPAGSHSRVPVMSVWRPGLAAGADARLSWGADGSPARALTTPRGQTITEAVVLPSYSSARRPFSKVASKKSPYICSFRRTKGTMRLKASAGQSAFPHSSSALFLRDTVGCCIGRCLCWTILSSKKDLIRWGFVQVRLDKPTTVGFCETTQGETIVSPIALNDHENRHIVRSKSSS